MAALPEAPPKTAFWSVLVQFPRTFKLVFTITGQPLRSLKSEPTTKIRRAWHIWQVDFAN
jgi:hypothetical protein